MSRSFQDYIDRAQSLMDAGFGTKEAKKDANDYIGRAFDLARQAFHAAHNAERGEGVAYHEMPEAWRMLDMPFSAAHWNAKRAASLAAYPEAVRLANICAELRAKIVATPVQKKPPQKTAKQREADEKARTCQICGRPIFAETGVIAHHGYQRPGEGWQTASCPGARELPFESDKVVLDKHIEGVRAHIAKVVQARQDVASEKKPVVIHYDIDRMKDGKRVYYRGERLTDTITIEVTRANFDEMRAAHPGYFLPGYSGRAAFAMVLHSDLTGRQFYIAQQLTYLKWQEERAAAWKQIEMIRWEDKSRHTPRGRLTDAPPSRTIEQAKDDRERCLNPEASAAGWIVAFCPHCQNKRAKTNPTA